MSEADTSDHGMVEELLAGLLKTLDVSGNERVTHRAFSKILTSRGLLADDPRLQTMFEALNDVDTVDIAIADLAGIARLGGKIVIDALQSKVVIPDFAQFKKEIEEIYNEVAALEDTGSVADYIPQLAKVDPTKFAVAVTTIDGQRFSFGDADESFCLQSSSKPITYALALKEHGMEVVHEHVGREPSGRAFNEMALKEVPEKERVKPDRVAIPHNPCINAGAIMCTSLVKPRSPLADRLEAYLNVWTDVCGQRVGFDPTVMVSERATADRNNALAYMMKESGSFTEPIKLDETLEFYFSTCAVTVNAKMMASATAAATLANGGENPLTQKRVFSDEHTRMAMSLMLSCGMYDFSGEWAFSVGLPAKSGVSGVLKIIVPNVCGICVWAPPLDRIGNSVKGIKFAEALVKKFCFHHLDSHVRSSKIDPTNRTTNSNDAAALFDLLTAASGGDLATVQALLARGTKIDAMDYDKRTALHLAASDGRVEVVNFLLAQGANPHVQDRWGNSPLEDASRGSFTEIAEVLSAAMATSGE